MGKGDKKTKRGKIVNGSYGRLRRRKKLKAKFEKPVVADVPKEIKAEIAEGKAKVKKVAVKKTIAKKVEVKKSAKSEEKEITKPAAKKAPAKKVPAKTTTAKVEEKKA